MHKGTLSRRYGLPLAGATVALLLTACGSSASTSGKGDPGSGPHAQTAAPEGFPKGLLPADVLPDLPLVAPKSDLDTPLFTDIVDIEPGGDKTFCTYTNLIVDEDTVFGEAFGAQSPFGHHAILQYTTKTAEPHTDVCGQMDGPIMPGGSAGKNVADKPTLPENFGITVPKGAQLVINHHWINTGEEPVKGQSMMLARRLAGGDTVAAGNLPMLGLGWEIPPNGNYTYSSECTYGEDVSYVLALGHMHEYGSHVNIDVNRTDGTTESLIDEEWSAESGTTAAGGGKIFTLEDPYVVHKGDTVKLTCNWKNTTANSIDFPREMCVFFGYTIGSSAFCVNGNWLNADQLASSGVNAQDITSNL